MTPVIHCWNIVHTLTTSAVLGIPLCNQVLSQVRAGGRSSPPFRTVANGGASKHHHLLQSHQRPLSPCGEQVDKWSMHKAMFSPRLLCLGFRISFGLLVAWGASTVERRLKTRNGKEREGRQVKEMGRDIGCGHQRA